MINQEYEQYHFNVINICLNYYFYLSFVINDMLGGKV